MDGHVYVVVWYIYNDLYVGSFPQMALGTGLSHTRNQATRHELRGKHTICENGVICRIVGDAE